MGKSSSNAYSGSLLGLSQFLKVWMLLGLLIRMVPRFVQNLFLLFLGVASSDPASLCLL